MDGTIIPPDRGKGRFEAIRKFDKLVKRNKKLALAFVTGRHLELALKGIEKYELPLPDILVCDVGTAIYLRTGNKWELDQTYRKGLKKSWAGFSRSDIAKILADMTELKEQEKEKLKEFKQSYYLSTETDRDKLFVKIETRLKRKKINANLIYSVDSKKNVGLLDVLPATASKYSALRYIQRKLNLKKDRIVYAGDSGNDMPVFTSGLNCIIVGNTRKEVKEEVQRIAVQKGIAEKLFFARHKYTEGVIDGCLFFNIFGR